MSSSKKIAFFGTGGIFSNIVLKHLIDSNILISVVIILVKRNSKLVPLNERLCQERNIEYIKIYDTNTNYLINQLQLRKISLGIVASYNQIFKANMLNALRDGFINVHPSILPFYKGANPIFWQIKDLNDEFGVTIHRINEKIDDGEILAQTKVNLSDTYDSDVIFNEIALAAAQLLIEVIKKYTCFNKLSAFTNEEIALSEKGFYNPKPVESDFEVFVLEINPFILNKLVMRLKKWGDAFFVYRESKILIDRIEDIDLASGKTDIEYIGPKRWHIISEHGSFTLIAKAEYEE